MRNYIQSFKGLMEIPHKCISGSPADFNVSEKVQCFPIHKTYRETLMHLCDVWITN